MAGLGLCRVGIIVCKWLNRTSYPLSELKTQTSTNLRWGLPATRSPRFILVK
ncbi:hypothetical protein Plhal304r1_c072g0160521 [Plasmopara halstedii]